MIEGMFDYGSMPATERLVQFTSARHQLLLHNIANISTPNYRAKDLSVESFQKTLGRAIDERRGQVGGANRELQVQDTDELTFNDDHITAEPHHARDGILYHDRNDRSIETQMKDLAENTMTYKMALTFLSSQYQLLETTIRERV